MEGGRRRRIDIERGKEEEGEMDVFMQSTIHVMELCVCVQYHGKYLAIITERKREVMS